MKHRDRLDRLARGVEDLEPDHDVVTEAMAEFRRIGRLPRDTKTARAVTKWAETGEPPGQDAGSLLERLCVFVGEPKPPPPPQDVVMQGLYEDAVFGDELDQTVARVMLVTLAKAGFDPSTPVWAQLGWEVPVMTCNSMALTLIGFPGSFVRPQHRRRTVALAEKLRGFLSGYAANQARRDKLTAAAEVFFETGRLPSDPNLVDATLWNAEITAYCQTWMLGADYTREIQALRAYWRAPASGRAAALAELRAAVRAGPVPAAVEPDLWTSVKRLVVPFIRRVMDASEALA